MSVAAVLIPVADLVATAVDKTPKDDDVKAGWTAFVIFLLLIGAVVVLGFSLVKQLRRAEAAKAAGIYGDEPEVDEPDAESAGPPSGQAPNHSATP
jgi:hypothetical protein